MIGNHDCTRGFSTKFVGISSSLDFVAKWSELTDVEESSETTTSDKSATPPVAATTGASCASRGVLAYDQPSPSKKRKYMTNALDDAIERAKIGDN